MSIELLLKFDLLVEGFRSRNISKNRRRSGSGSGSGLPLAAGGHEIPESVTKRLRGAYADLTRISGIAATTCRGLSGSSDRRRPILGPSPMANGQWPMAHDPCAMGHGPWAMGHGPWPINSHQLMGLPIVCLLYTSDAADE